MIHVIPTGRGGHRLHDENNHSYRIDEKINDKTYWKCIEHHCKARVHTKNDTSIGIIKRIGEHSHCSNPSKHLAYKIKSDLRSRSNGCAEKSCSLIRDAARNLDTTSMTIWPSTPNLSREVRCWKQKENIVPTTPPRRTGFGIPLTFQKLDDGCPFLVLTIRK